jgi:hypothetical protein
LTSLPRGCNFPTYEIILFKERRHGMRQIILVMLSVMLLSNCVPFSHSSGTQIDEKALKQIEIRKTTRGDILKMFGAPDKIIDSGIAGALKSQTKGDVELTTKQEVAVGKNQEIYIYEYVEREGHYGFSDSSTVRRNTLMVWINKDTGIVEDYGYNRQIR